MSTDSFSLAVLVALMGCAPGPDAVSTKALEGDETTEALPAGAARRRAEPEDTVTLLGRALLARHPEDLPGREKILALQGGVAALNTLAHEADRTMVAARAAERLGLFDEPEARAWLLALASDTTQPAQVRAGAVQGLVLAASDPAARARIAELALGPEPRVAAECLRALAEVPALSAEREALLQRSTLSPEVRAALLPR